MKHSETGVPTQLRALACCLHGIVQLVCEPQVQSD